jgi:hypothetical protein
VPTRHHSQIDCGAALYEQCAQLAEALSAGIAKAGAVGLLVRISQLRTRIAQDRTAGTAQKNLAEMIFLASSMVALGIGTIRGDQELVNRAKGAGPR